MAVCESVWPNGQCGISHIGKEKAVSEGSGTNKKYKQKGG